MDRWKYLAIFFLAALLEANFLGFAKAEEQKPAVSDPVVDNNLFAPDRSPHKASPQDVKAPQAAPSDLQLDGVLLWGDKKFAVFKVNTPALIGEEKARKSPYVTVSEGGQIGSYKVVSVQKSQVVLEQGGQQTTIQLFKATKQTPQISVPLPVVSTAPAQPANTPGSSPMPQPQPSPQGSPGETSGSTPSGVQQQQPNVSPPQEPHPAGEQVSEKMPFPSPEEFEKLSPEQKEEVVKKMQNVMGAKVKAMKKQ